MRLTKTAALLLTLAATLCAARFGIGDIGKIVRLTDPQIAPDGKSIAIVVSRTNYEEDRYDPELVLIDIARAPKSPSRATAAAWARRDGRPTAPGWPFSPRSTRNRKSSCCP